MKRLKRSILAELYEPNFTINKKVKRVYKLSMSNRGGDIVDFPLSEESFKLAEKIKTVVEELTAFLKKDELKGTLGIFFKNGRIILYLILKTYRIRINYISLVQELSLEVIVLIITLGDATSLTLFWYLIRTTLIISIIVTIFVVKSTFQTIVNNLEFLTFISS